MEPPTPAIDETAVKEAAQRLSELPFQLVEGSPMGWPPEWLAEVAQQLVSMAAERGIDTQLHPPLIVLDFLQLVGDPRPLADTPSPRSLDMRQRIQQAAYRAREIARRHGVAVLAVSSTARESAKALRIEQDKPLPYPGDLVGTGKESGEIEYSADGVLVLVEHPDAQKDPPDKGLRLVSVALAKVRAGEQARLWLTFDGSKHTALATDAGWRGAHNAPIVTLPPNAKNKSAQDTDNQKSGITPERKREIMRGKP
jgi:replicative DNA helicase